MANAWHEAWWRIAIAPWLDEAKRELACLLPSAVAELGEEDDRSELEDLAHRIAFEFQPIDNDEIAALAELYPSVWAYACSELDEGLGWGPGTEYQALQAGIVHHIWLDLLDLLPHEDEDLASWQARNTATREHLSALADKGGATCP